jgi:hypothetical protein
MTRDEWRQAAIDAWYAAQDHIGQADCDPEPYLKAAADAAVGVAMKHLPVNEIADAARSRHPGVGYNLMVLIVQDVLELARRQD